MINDVLNLLYWREPWVLILLVLPLLLVAFNRAQQKRQWNKLADEALQPWLKAHNKQSNTVRSLPFLALSWIGFVIALAGPRLIDWVPPEQQAKPASLIVVLDLSASMYANDAYPSRRSQAINWLKQSINEKPNHLKMGLILFAGHAFNLMPPTLDKNIIKHYTSQLDKLPLPTLGNDLSAALTLAKQQFKPSDIEQHIVILSDGDLSQPEQQRTLANLKNNLTHQSLHFIGFGGKTAVKIPKPNGGFVLSKGRPAQSRLELIWLYKMAALPFVSYQHITDIKQQSLKQTIQLKTPRLSQQAQQQVLWHELFTYPLIVAFLLFIFSLIRINAKHSSSLLLSVLLIPIVLSHSPKSQADDNTLMQQAQTALKEKSYPLAQKLFNQIDSPTAAFGEGIACYRQANFKCATRAFSKTAWQAKTKKIRANAVFNLANSYFFLGEYEQATILFNDAKNLGFDAKSAQLNLEFSNSMQQAVLKRIADIKEVFRRAKWRAAAAGTLPPTLNSIISQQNNFAIDRNEKSQNYLIRKAIALKINRQLGFQNSENTATRWIKTELVTNQSTAQLLKRLLEMDLAIPAPLKEPQTIEGKRPW